jgi:ABC-type glutathione transport system ATPase component
LRQHARHLDGTTVVAPAKWCALTNSGKELADALPLRDQIRIQIRAESIRVSAPPSAVSDGRAPPAGKGDARITVKGLGKRYGVLEVFRNIDFAVGEREIVAIVGPSGCGKTTLLRCIDGLLPQ